MREGDNVLGRGGGRQRQPQHCQDAKCQTKLCGAIGLFHSFPSSLLSYIVAEPLIHMSFCPDKPILAGFSGSFAPYPFSALAGRYDGDVICLTRLPVNNPNPYAGWTWCG